MESTMADMAHRVGGVGETPPAPAVPTPNAEGTAASEPTASAGAHTGDTAVSIGPAVAIPPHPEGTAASEPTASAGAHTGDTAVSIDAAPATDTGTSSSASEPHTPA